MIFLCLNIYVGGQAIQWIPFQNCIYDGRLEIQDGRPGTLILSILKKNITEKFSTVKWK